MTNEESAKKTCMEKGYAIIALLETDFKEKDAYKNNLIANSIVAALCIHIIKNGNEQDWPRLLESIQDHIKKTMEDTITSYTNYTKKKKSHA